MMNLESILNEWKDDCELQNNLEDASRETPKLHAKYLQYYSLSKLQLRKLENQQKLLLKDKWLYYSGKMDQETLAQKGWNPDPFDGLKVMKGDMDHWYDSDPDIQKSVDRIEYFKTICDTLKEIVENIKWRHQTIGNVIKWRQFEAGG